MLYKVVYVSINECTVQGSGVLFVPSSKYGPCTRSIFFLALLYRTRISSVIVKITGPSNFWRYCKGAQVRAIWNFSLFIKWNTKRQQKWTKQFDKKNPECRATSLPFWLTVKQLAYHLFCIFKWSTTARI